jgi:hypothetical protein
MEKRVPIALFTVLIFFLFTGKSFAQLMSTDSSSQQPAFSNAVSLLSNSLGEQSPLYNGPEYYFYDHSIKGNAYFMDVNMFAAGSVFYEGQSFKNVQMLYDLYTDDVAVLLYNHFLKFYLLKPKVKSFDFLEHHFVNISNDTISNKSIIKSGYYDELYNGKVQVLVKRTKSIQTTSSLVGLEKYFSPAVDYYIRKNKVYYSFSGQGELLDILKDRKKEIQQYIKANKIKFRDDREQAMVKIVSYYDHITN